MSISTWRLVTTSRAYRIHQAPKPSVPTEGDIQLGQRLATLVSSYHSGSGPFVLGWFRPAPSGPIDVCVGGVLSSDAGTDSIAEETVLSLPAAALGRRLPNGLGPAITAVPCWTRIVPRSDGLLGKEDAERRPDQVRPSIEDALLGVWRAPFAWLLTAEPVAADALEEEIADVADRARVAHAKADSSPDYAIAAARLDARHRELSAAVSIGAWRTQLFAGSDTPSGARGVAGLVIASADLATLPYTLAPTGPVDAAEVVFASAVEAPMTDTMFVAAMAMTPAVEIPGVRLAPRPLFDVTPETEPDEGAPVRLGVVLDRNGVAAGPLDVPRSSLNRHTFVCGATGSGKSQTVRNLLESASRIGLPWLVVEPAKAEYRLMAARLVEQGGDVLVVRPGDVDAAPAGLNPLEPAVGPDGSRFPLQTHADLVRALFLAAFAADEPFPQVLSAALTLAYEELGWDLVLGEPADPLVTPRYPTLLDLEHAAERVVERIGYGREVTDNVRGFVRVRLAGLRAGTTGRFFEGGHPIDFDALLRRNVVFEIEDVGDDRDKAFLMGVVLVRLVEHLRLRHREHGGAASPLKHLSVFEEAHRLLRRSEDGPAAHAVEMFAGLLAEIRAYGEGIVVAEQIPDKLATDVVKNTAVKIVHRLPARDDRDAVGATMNLTDEQSEHLVTLRPGRAAVFADGMDHPVLVQMPDGTARESGEAVPPASPVALVTARSASCAVECRSEPCTLRRIRRAHRVLTTVPGVAVWAELAVLAHLTGWPTPMPVGDLLDAVRALDRRTRDCTLSHAVDDAVAARGPAVPDMDPAGLSAHVTDVLRDHVASGAQHREPEQLWLARGYRWCHVWDALAVVDRVDPDAGRHPSSAAWEAALGMPVPGETNGTQLAVVKRRFDLDVATVPARELALGSRPRPALAVALGSEPGDPGWVAAVTTALAGFGSPRWPMRYLGSLR